MRLGIFGVICILLGMIFQARAQSCYIQLDDATGVDISTYIAELEATACALRDAFPETLQDSFAVYDFGFYLHHGGYEGGVPQVFQNKVAEVGGMSKYYIIFGRELHIDVGISKVWVELSLPLYEHFECFSTDMFSKFKFMIFARANSSSNAQATVSDNFFNNIFNAIRFAELEVTKMVDAYDPFFRESCSTCSWTFDNVRTYTKLFGFTNYEIQISPSHVDIDTTCFCQDDVEINKQNIGLGTGKVVAVTRYDSLFLGNNFKLSVDQMFQMFTDLGILYEEENKVFFGAVTDQYAFCHEGELSSLRSEIITIDDIQSGLLTSDVGIWVQVLHYGGDARLSILTKGIEATGVKWMLDFIAKFGQDEDQVDFSKVVFELKSENPFIIYDRCGDFYELLVTDSDALVRDCFTGSNDPDLQFWSDLANFIPASEVITKISNLGPSWKLQPVTTPTLAPSINLDYFEVKITKMPYINGSNGPRFSDIGLMEKIRKDLNSFVNTVYGEFKPYNQDEYELWQSANPLSSIITIEIIFDDGSVVCSNYNPCCWVFSTLTAPMWPPQEDGTHPVSGNREFAITNNGDGSYSFYAKGVDRYYIPRFTAAGVPLIGVKKSALLIYILEQTAFTGGDLLWTSMQTKVAGFINAKGGSAIIMEPIKNRPVAKSTLKVLLESSSKLSKVPCGN